MLIEAQLPEVIFLYVEAMNKIKWHNSKQVSLQRLKASMLMIHQVEADADIQTNRQKQVNARIDAKITPPKDAK